MLYLIHVPWKWVKQRPHFLAEYLSNYYDIDVYFKKQYQKRGLVKNQPPGDLRIHELFKLPFERFSSIILKVNFYIVRFQLKKIINQFDIVWVTEPGLYHLVSGILPNNVKLIYDCMDDALESPKVKLNKKLAHQLFYLEKELLDKSDIIFSSSDYLKAKLLERYRVNDKKIFVVNNAVFIDQNENFKKDNLSEDIINQFQKAKFKITYIGAISEWFDFELILESLNKFKEITYLLFGPDFIEIPKHKRIIHFGSIEHEYIYQIMENSDLLIMPFKLNELILSVNPVKLYEYIYSGKPCAAVEYGESLKFKDYVYLYKNKKEYFKILEKLVNQKLSPKKSGEECKFFAENNTWEKRAKFMAKIIDKN